MKFVSCSGTFVFSFDVMGIVGPHCQPPGLFGMTYGGKGLLKMAFAFEIRKFSLRAMLWSLFFRVGLTQTVMPIRARVRALEAKMFKCLYCQGNSLGQSIWLATLTLTQIAHGRST